MKKTIYIHIGRPKVGSTAIQKFLKINRKQLLDSGCLYPETGEHQGASHKLAQTLLANKKQAHDIPASKLYKALTEEFQQSPVSSCIISSENFYFVEPIDVAEQLSDNFDVKIVCYVRRQDEVIVSSYIQELREDSLLESEKHNLDAYSNNPMRLGLLNYENMLDRWAKIFGKRNIIVRVYEVGQLKDNLFTDILDVLGLVLNDSYKLPDQRLNPSPPSDVLELIKSINSYPASLLIKRQLKTRLIEISEHLVPNVNYDSKRIFSIDQRKQVLARFEKSNAYVARNYLNRHDGRLFFDEIEKVYAEEFDSIPCNVFDLNRLVQIWLGIFVYQQEELIKLGIRVNKLQDEAANSD